jgi:hypothetical protein
VGYNCNRGTTVTIIKKTAAFDEGGHYHGDRDSLVLNRRRYVFLTNPAVIAREDANRLGKVNAAELKREKAEKNREAAAAKLAGGIVPKKRAKKNVPIELVFDPVIEPSVL